MKKILLQTMPQTGTHTMHYLFNVLGGIEVIWHHWEESCLEDIEIVAGVDWKDFVFVRTYRNPAETLNSYRSRAVTANDGAAYYNKCLAVYAHHNRRFPVSITIDIGASNALKTRNALEVFRRCEVVIPEAALDYIKSWKRINSHHDKETPSRAIKDSIHKGRVQIWHTK